MIDPILDRIPPGCPPDEPVTDALLVDKKAQAAIGEDFSQRFAEFVSRQEISDPSWENEIQAAAEEAFHWAFDTLREQIADDQ